MAVLTLKNDEYSKFPEVLKNYASHMHIIKWNTRKRCES